jgi:hypothetical protein
MAQSPDVVARFAMVSMVPALNIFSSAVVRFSVPPHPPLSRQYAVSA